MNPFSYSNTNKRYHTYSYALTERFGGKVSRICLDGGFTCPNLDGTCGTGGCTFCVGRTGAQGCPTPIPVQFEQGVRLLERKWPTAMHIAYFHMHTNTYAPVSRLRALYEEALGCPGVVGLAIATRPDCLSEEVCGLLEQLAARTYLTVELGLQTIHPETARIINRCHSFEAFMEGYERLRRHGILTGVHLINGLPGETAGMMLESARAVGCLRPHLVKLHLLHLLRGSAMAQMPVRLMELDDYVQLVCDQLELLPAACVIGRLTGDGASDLLIGPHWSRRKRMVLNSIDREMAFRNSWQGKKRAFSNAEGWVLDADYA